jgi:uncharacterized protein YfiM (DUF2279 family)
MFKLDKLLHFLVCFAIAASCGIIGAFFGHHVAGVTTGLFLALVAGVAKEWYDERKKVTSNIGSGCSNADLMADFAGVFAGVLTGIIIGGVI